MMIGRLPKALLATVLALSSTPSIAQTTIGRDSAPGRYNRLQDAASRGLHVVQPMRPDVFGTAAIPAGVTFYDARFRRVSAADREDPRIVEMAAALRGKSQAEQLDLVQALVKSHVRYMSDLDNVKVSDLWLNAGETLQRGAGDSEDIAIVEMQVLKAAGFAPRDLYISIGRRKDIGAHVVLLARTDNGFYALDDKIDHPVPAQDSSQFTPMLTVGQGLSFIHGRRVGFASTRVSAR